MVLGGVPPTTDIKEGRSAAGEVPLEHAEIVARDGLLIQS